MENRRDFFRLSGLAGLGLAGSTVLEAFSTDGKTPNKQKVGTAGTLSSKPHVQKFNMSGYAAPKLDVVRIGFIGVGSRGAEAVV